MGFFKKAEEKLPGKTIFGKRLDGKYKDVAFLMGNPYNLESKFYFQKNGELVEINFSDIEARIVVCGFEYMNNYGYEISENYICEADKLQRCLKSDKFENAVYLKLIAQSYPGLSITYDHYYIIDTDHIEVYNSIKEEYSYTFDGKIISSQEASDLGYSFSIYKAVSPRTTSLLEKEGVQVFTLEVFDNFKDELNCSKYFVKKDDLDKVCMSLPDNQSELKNLISCSAETNYILKSDYDRVIEDLKKPHKVYKIIGSDKPPYFIVNDKIFEADTENWYEFCLKYFFKGKVQLWMLEEK